MRVNVVKEKSFLFAIRIINLYKFLKKEQNEFILSKQIMKSGTSVGALIRESEQAESLKDFIHKLSIALKEINETLYWIELLFQTAYLEEKLYSSLKKNGEELLKLLTAIIKTNKLKLPGSGSFSHRQ